MHVCDEIAVIRIAFVNVLPSKSLHRPKGVQN